MHTRAHTCHVRVRADSMRGSVYRSHCFDGSLLLCCCGTKEACVRCYLPVEVVFDGPWFSFPVNPTTVGVQIPDCYVGLGWAASIRV